MAEGTIQELQHKVWDAANLMRSAGLNTLDYIEHFTYFLFLKLLDDQERQREQADPTYRTRLSDDRWRFYHWVQDEPDLPGFIGHQLFLHLAQTPDRPGVDNSDLRMIFADAYLLLREPEALRQVLGIVRTINLEDYDFDIKGQVYEFLLAKMANEAGQLGQFFTPRHLIDLMVSLVDPQVGETVYDPASGTGGFLIRAYQHLHDALTRDDPDNAEKWHFLRQETIYGRELSPRAHKLGVMNMILHGDGHSHLACGDSLSASTQEPDRYHVILTNPPFGSVTVPRQDLADFPVRTRNPESLFLQHIMLSLKPGGRAAMIVPEGLLFRGGAERKIRQRLLEDFVVEAVISLPAGIFLPYTSVKADILVFCKGDPSQRVWFFEVQNDGFELTAAHRPIPGRNDLHVLREQWDTKPETEQSWWANVEHITQMDYVLSANRYMPSRAKIGRYPRVPLDKLLRHHKEWITIADDDLYKRVTVRLHGGGIILRDTVYGRQLRTKRQQVARTGQMLVAEIDAKSGALGVVPSELDGAIVSSHYFLYDVLAETVRLEFLDYCLRSRPVEEAIQPFVRGSTNYAAIRPPDLLQIEIPLPPLDIQANYVARLDSQEEIMKRADELARTIAKGTLDEAIFKGYEMHLLGDLLVERPRYGTSAKASREPMGHPVLRMNNIVNGWLDLSNLKYLSLTTNELDKYRLRAGDLLINRTNSKKLVGKCAVFDQEGTCVFASYLIRFRFNPEIVDPFYVAAFLNSSAGRREIDARSRQVTNQANINVREIRSIPIPLPSLDTQRQIAAQVKEEHDALMRIQQLKAKANRAIDQILDELFK